MTTLPMEVSTSPRFPRLSTDPDYEDVAIDYSKSGSRMSPEGLSGRIPLPLYRVPTKGMRKAYPEEPHQYVSPSPHHHNPVVPSPPTDHHRMDHLYAPVAYSTIPNHNNHNSQYYSTPPPPFNNDLRFNYNNYESPEEMREYQCLKCGLIFSRESDLHLHYTQDHGFGGQNSDMCGGNRALQSSSRSSSGQELFCDKCQLRFHCPLSFRVHQHEHVLPNVQPHYPMSNSHLLSLSYSCEICGANFMSRESLTDHANAHLYEHVCSESTCGESDSTATNSSEDFYQRDNSSQHQYHIEHPTANLVDNNDSSAHLLHQSQQHHLHHQQIMQHQVGPKADDQLIVNQGPNTYSSEYSSSYHQHEISPPITTSSKSGALIYEPLIVVDNGKRRFQCVICKKYLSSRIAHEEHTRGKHTGDKPYSCTYCGKRFAVWNTYKHHMSTHKGGVTPLQKCALCDKRFKTIECLRNHMQREHNCLGGGGASGSGGGGGGGTDGNGNNTAGYSCQICGKTFVRKMWRTRHYLSHAGQNCFRCELCSCILPDEQSYRVHHESHKASN